MSLLLEEGKHCVPYSSMHYFTRRHLFSSANFQCIQLVNNESKKFVNTIRFEIVDSTNQERGQLLARTRMLGRR